MLSIENTSNTLISITIIFVHPISTAFIELPPTLTHDRLYFKSEYQRSRCMLSTVAFEAMRQGVPTPMWLTFHASPSPTTLYCLEIWTAWIWVAKKNCNLYANSLNTGLINERPKSLNFLFAGRDLFKYRHFKKQFRFKKNGAVRQMRTRVGLLVQPRSMR